jgi:hypothetical protein
MHHTKINEQRKTIPALAVKWNDSGNITHDEYQEIGVRVSKANFNDWRPIIYIIPVAGLGARVRRVAADQWAGFEPEYIIEDLKKDEFDIIEP